MVGEGHMTNLVYEVGVRTRHGRKPAAAAKKTLWRVGGVALFDPFLGLGLSGPLADRNLGRLPGFTSFRSDYLTFFPEGRTWPD